MSLEVVKTNFSLNRAVSGPGGVAVLYGSGSSRYSFQECVFDQNYAAQVGGAFALWGVAGDITNSKMINNSVGVREQGSAISMEAGSTLAIVRFAQMLIYCVSHVMYFLPACQFTIAV